MSKKQAGKTCIIRGCQRKRTSRGLCQKCYVAIRAQVKAGKRTWEELEELGFALPVHKTGRPDQAMILKALKKKTSKKTAKKQSAK